MISTKCVPGSIGVIESISLVEIIDFGEKSDLPTRTKIKCVFLPVNATLSQCEGSQGEVSQNEVLSSNLRPPIGICGFDVQEDALLAAQEKAALLVQSEPVLRLAQKVSLFNNKNIFCLDGKKSLSFYKKINVILVREEELQLPDAAFSLYQKKSFSLHKEECVPIAQRKRRVEI